MESIRILIADDEAGIRELIKEYSAPEGFIMDEASDGVEAMNHFKANAYHLIVLDVMMPKMDGWTVLREIRKTSQVPVVLLTARGEEYDKLFGFELGVDDYIVKPFSPRELLARLKAIIRRSASPAAPQNQNVMCFDGLTVEFDARNVVIDGQSVSLTPKEYELLVYFVKNANRVLSREQLLNAVWGYDFPGEDRTVDTHVKMLRESIGPYRNFIKTVWGTGYKFEAGKKP